MVQRLQAALAVIAAVALLVGGSTFALWGDSDGGAVGVITSGDLAVEVGSETWWDLTPGRAPQQIQHLTTMYQTVPGDVLEGRFPVEIELEGNNLLAELSVLLEDASGDLKAVPHGVDLSFTVLGGDDAPIDGLENLPIPATASMEVRSADNDAPEHAWRPAYSGWHDGDPDLTVVVTARFDADTPGTTRMESSLQLGDLVVRLEQVRDGSADLADALFHADIATQGIDKIGHPYAPYLVDGTDYGVTTDPAGSGRSVLWMEPVTTEPDTMFNTPSVMRPGQTYWMEYSFYLPSASAITDAGAKTILSIGAKAPPHGWMPLRVALRRPDVSGSHRVVMEDGGEVISSAADVPMDTWVTVTMNFKAAEDGWVQMWIDSGDGPQRLQIHGEDRPAFAVIRPGINDGGNLYAAVGVNGSHKKRIYFGDLAIGTTQTSANIDGRWVDF